MSLSDQIFNFATSLMQKTGYGGVFFLMMLESATLPVPSEVVLPFAGYLVYLGQLDFWTAVAVASAGSLVGTLIDYSIGYSLGRGAVLRYGTSVGLDEARLRTAESWFQGDYGELTVLLARFVPLLRTLIAFPAGVARMKLWRFVVFSAVGVVVWDAALIYVGLEAGQDSSAIISSLTGAYVPTEVAVAIALIVAAVVVLRRRPVPAAPAPS
ncbi:MAG: DedA family protein [Nitrososphaerales archaeon]